MFFDNFLALCELKKVAPTKAVIDAGLPKSSWSYWKKKYEQGEDPKPSSDNTSKLASYFGVTVDYLLTGKDPEQKEKPNALDGIELEKLSPARRALLEALEGMDDENIMKIVRIAQAVKKELPE